MSLGTWVETYIVEPTVKIILQPENLKKIAEAMGNEIIADNDRVILAVRADVNAVAADLTGSIAKVDASITDSVNKVVNNLFDRLQNIIPGFFKGFGQ